MSQEVFLSIDGEIDSSSQKPRDQIMGMESNYQMMSSTTNSNKYTGQLSQSWISAKNVTPHIRTTMSSREEI